MPKGGSGKMEGLEGRSATANLQISIDTSFLSDVLIRRANDLSSTNIGNSIKNQYAADIAEINQMTFSEQEKKSALSKLHELTTAELKAYATGMPSALVAGPARHNVGASSRRANAAATSTQNRRDYMNQLRTIEDKRRTSARRSRLVDAMQNAQRSGKSEFVFEGKKYIRRGRSFVNSR